MDGWSDLMPIDRYMSNRFQMVDDDDDDGFIV